MYPFLAVVGLALAALTPLGILDVFFLAAHLGVVTYAFDETTVVLSDSVQWWKLEDLGLDLITFDDSFFHLRLESPSDTEVVN